MSNASKTVRGLGIAILVLSILGLIAALAGLACGGALAILVSDESFVDALSQEFLGVPSTIYMETENANIAMGTSNLSGVLDFVSLLLILLCVWCIICSILSLVAGVLAMRNFDKPQKLGTIFGWAIAGAILNFLCGSLILLVLFIILAVYAKKARKEAEAAACGYAPQGAYAYAAPTQQDGNFIHQ